MKKRTINALLTALNILLVIAIIVLIVKISTRKPASEEVASNSDQHVSETLDNSGMSSEADSSEMLSDMASESPEPVTESVLVAVPQSTTSVNVRSGPGTGYDRIGSAYTDCEYEVIEIYDSGWTKLDYDGMEGYISNDFLCFKYRSELSDGNVSYTDVSISELNVVTQTDVPELPAEASEPETGVDASENTEVVSDNAAE